jgi:hypothetical protein
MASTVAEERCWRGDLRGVSEGAAMLGKCELQT